MGVKRNLRLWRIAHNEPSWRMFYKLRMRPREETSVEGPQIFADHIKPVVYKRFRRKLGGPTNA